MAVIFDSAESCVRRRLVVDRGKHQQVLSAMQIDENSYLQRVKMKNIIRKVAKEGLETEFIILNADYEENCISLTLIDGDISWTGKFDPEEMDSFCNLFNKEREVYFKEIIEALRDGNNFIFTIEKETFIMKKIDSKTNIKIRYCTIPLTKISSLPTYSLLVGRLLDNQAGYKNCISQMSEELAFLKHEREDMLKNLELLINEKASMETTLYSKFCEVLNTKKLKISSLEHQLASSRPTEQQSECPKIKVEKPEEDTSVVKGGAEDLGESSDHQRNTAMQEDCGVSEEATNHYDSETDIDTDEEPEQHDVQRTKIRVEVSKPPSPPSMDVNKKRILPKRIGSKTNTQLAKESSIEEKPAAKNVDELCEFNSQSLFEEC